MASPLHRAGLVAAAFALALTATACGGPSSRSGDGAGPVTLNIVDVAGNLQLTEQIIKNFQKAYPQELKAYTASKTDVTQMPGKLEAQFKAGRTDIDMVLTGIDGYAATVSKNLLDPVGAIPGQQNYLAGARAAQNLAGTYAVTINYNPNGPLLEFAADVTDPPTSWESLLTWARANPKRFQYALPAKSGPGRALLMALAHHFGENELPPAKWTKTWNYLKLLKPHVTLASSTGETMKNLANGSSKVVVSSTGWDLNPRALGTVPPDVKVVAPGTAVTAGKADCGTFTWIADAHYVLMPKGLSQRKQDVIRKLIAFMLTPEQQAITADQGYLYTGWAIEGVDLSKAPPSSREVFDKFDRPDYYRPLIEQCPVVPSFEAGTIQEMFAEFDRQVGK
ncbi:putative spermidine/putrescine transport system substrate-binding protein [Krasilnikovia cinnamomea]|uniref:Putative spermidine/putrescine transport system substrate-binding protein n=1 Tax=Krasilnikovia cinnamomea TaxID=349313 RepID=A0A4Q7ZS26_9ACTN|nr:extracellular solute-binding protein [Krasilnikovia cinnamomea]RZU53413.1 putative spermidine/putrescine transport system substrate-binding protein [Krasilnikovia cinnamomea]